MDFLAHTLKAEFKWPALRKGDWRRPESHLKLPNVELVDNKRKIGIEVEVENIRHATEHDRGVWYTKEDGSLRNSGCEYITIPILGDDVLYAVDHLFQVLPKNADFSDRTSIHVHVNMRDFTKEHLLNLVLLYIVFERLLYRFAGPARYRNIFCVPVQETKLPIALMNFITNGNVSSLIREWHKYSGMNLLPIKTQGTIEFRHMEGNRDTLRVLNWINLLLAMFKYAKEISFNELFNRINRLNNNSYYEEFVRVVFKDQAALLIISNIKYFMEQGVSTVKEISLPSPFLINLMSGINNNSDLLLSLGISDKVKIPTQTTAEAPLDVVEPDLQNLNTNLDPFAAGWLDDPFLRVRR